MVGMNASVTFPMLLTIEWGAITNATIEERVPIAGVPKISQRSLAALSGVPNI